MRQSQGCAAKAKGYAQSRGLTPALQDYQQLYETSKVFSVA
jgi:hypothetical protein